LVRLVRTQPAIKRLFSLSPQPVYAFALPRESRSSEICVEINRQTEKNIPDIIDCNLNKDKSI